MPRPPSVLDCGRSGDETVGLSGLLQQVSLTRLAQGSDSDSTGGIKRSKFQILPLAETLSRSIPNANGCSMNTNSPRTGQDRALRSSIASVRGTIDRNAAPRMLGSDVVLDGCRPRSKARRFPTLLQRTSNTCRIERTTPASVKRPRASFSSYKWRRHCRGLYQTPIAA